MIKWLSGPIDYGIVWANMKHFTLSRNTNTMDEIWICEHMPVYTLGLSGKKWCIIDSGEIPVIHTDRGGQATYHGPGQVVVYILLDLRRAGLYIRDYVTRLETAILVSLKDMGILNACRNPGAPGVYVPISNELAKIAALGIRVRNGYAYHGVALNVDMDLSPFKNIHPCGYRGLQIVDMTFCGIRQNLIQAGNCLASNLIQIIYN